MLLTSIILYNLMELSRIVRQIFKSVLTDYKEVGSQITRSDLSNEYGIRNEELEVPAFRRQENGFGDRRNYSLDSKNSWKRGGHWWLFDDPFLYPDQLDGRVPEETVEFLSELQHVKDLSEKPIEKILADARARAGFKITPVDLSIDSPPVMNMEPAWEDFPPDQLHQARYSVDLNMSWDAYENLRIIAAETALRHRSEPDYIPCAKVDVNDPTIEDYDPMQEAPAAYLEFAGLVDDLWDEDIDGEDKDTVRKQKFLDFCKGYGPPTLTRGPDLELMLSGLTTEESQNRVIGEHRLHALIRWSTKRPLPNIYRCNYRDSIRQAIPMALALRCHQALYVDWDLYQPGLKRFLQSTEAVAFFNEHYRYTRMSIGTADMNDVDVPENLVKYLARVMSYSHSWDAFRVAHYEVDDRPVAAGLTAILVRKSIYSNLLTMLWAQLSEAVLNRTQVKICARDGCGKVFTASRSDQKYHSSQCSSIMSSRKFDSPSQRSVRQAGKKINGNLIR